MKHFFTDISKPIEAVIFREIHSLLSKVQSHGSLQTMEEGEEYICSTCDLKIKVCAGNPRAFCIRKARDQTQLDILEGAHRDSRAGGKILCLCCLQPIHTRAIQQNPLAELCDACRKDPFHLNKKASHAP